MLTNYFNGKSVLDLQIDEVPSSDLSLVIVIPSMNEPDLLLALEALRSCDKATGSVEVIIIINHTAGASSQIIETNENSYLEVRAWATIHSTAALRYYILYHPDLPSKKGGVGMARKIGMDEAARRLLMAGNEDGIIACFDADCTCTSDYLQILTCFFKAHPGTEGVSVHFEHPLNTLDESSRAAIIHYEMHLRYFIDAQRIVNIPFAYQTVGSSMAVRAGTYIKVGGMNTRKAGEDFYFLHKVIERGAHQDLNTTTIFPSARQSDRVPFGTGKAVKDLLEGASFTTYNPESFEDLRVFIGTVPKLYDATKIGFLLIEMPDSIREFLELNNFDQVQAELINNTASLESFVKRFFRWFNAFRLMKYMHFTRDHFYPEVPMREAVDWLFHELDIAPTDSLENRLIQLREHDKKTVY